MTKTYIGDKTWKDVETEFWNLDSFVPIKLSSDDLGVFISDEGV